jgi:hypothetical protein
MEVTPGWDDSAEDSTLELTVSLLMKNNWESDENKSSACNSYGWGHVDGVRIRIPTFPVLQASCGRMKPDTGKFIPPFD